MHLSRRFSGYSLLFYIIFTIVTSFLVLLIPNEILHTNYELYRILRTALLSVLGLIAVALILLYMRKRKFPVCKLILFQKTKITNVLFAIGIAVCVYLSLQLLHRLFQGAYDFFNNLYYAAQDGSHFSRQYFFPDNNSPVWPNILTTVLIPVASLTVLRHGIVQPGLQFKTQRRTAIAIGVLYMITSQYLIWPERFLIGWLMAFITMRSASIIPAFLGNLILSVFSLLNIDTLLGNLFVPAAQSIETSTLQPLFDTFYPVINKAPLTIWLFIIYLAAVAGLILLIAYFNRKTRKKRESQTPQYQTAPVSIPVPMLDTEAENQMSKTNIEAIVTPMVLPAADIGKRQNVGLIIAGILMLAWTLYNTLPFYLH